MRKCPNCKKAVPVGARRCVYCRMLIADSTNEAPIHNGQNSMTQMGFGNAKEDDYDSNNSTSLGLPGSSNFTPGIGSADKRVSHHIDVNEAPHQTMIGLGPITSNSSRNVNAPNKDMNSGMHTIAGMPGVSFDPSEVAAFKARLTPMRSTPIRPSQAVLNTPREAPVSIPNGIRRSSGNMTPIVQPTSPKSAQQPVSSVQQAVQSQPQMRPQSQANQPAITKSSPRFVPAAQPQKPASNDNLLAGLPGVAPVPSSLVDEEFVDLTSKVFGSDFAGVNDSFDDDEDGLDFDFPAAPAKPQPAEPAPQVIPIPSIPQPKVSAQPAAPAKPKTPEPAQPVTASNKPLVSPEPKKLAAAEPVQSEVPLKKASGGAMDYITLILAIASACACIAWLAFAAISLPALAILACAAVLSIIINALYFPLRKKLPPVAMTLIFMVAMVALFLAFFMQRDAIVSKFVYLIAMAGQFLTTICCFFRKS